MARNYELRPGFTLGGRKGWEVGYEERGNWICISKTFENKREGAEFLKVMQAFAKRKERQKALAAGKKSSKFKGILRCPSDYL